MRRTHREGSNNADFAPFQFFSHAAAISGSNGAPVVRVVWRNPWMRGTRA